MLAGIVRMEYSLRSVMMLSTALVLLQCLTILEPAGAIGEQLPTVFSDMTRMDEPPGVVYVFTSVTVMGCVKVYVSA